MTVRSLTITEEAYNILKARKYGNESFSEVIIRMGKNKVGAAAKFFGALKDDPESVNQMRKRIAAYRAQVDKESIQRQKIIRERLS